MDHPEGCNAYDGASGARIVQIDFVADPDKRPPQWIKETTKGMSPRRIRQEYYRDKTVQSGLPVYEDWDDNRHLPKQFRKAKMEPIPEALYFGGWDTGDTLNQAFLLWQWDASEKQSGQIQSLGELTGFNESVEAFAPRVTEYLMREFPTVFPIYHVGDPDVMKRSGHTAITAQVLLAKHGFMVHPSTNLWQVRHSSMTWLLNDVIREEEEKGVTFKTHRFVVCGKMCKFLVSALRGEYKWEETTASESSYGPAAKYRQKPSKNAASHIANAGEYLAIEMKRRIDMGVPKIQRSWRGV